jgi:anti-anti-sigma factor
LRLLDCARRGPTMCPSRPIPVGAVPAYVDASDVRWLPQTPATTCRVAEGSIMSSEPEDSFSIVVTVAPDRRADLILSGDIDRSADARLAEAVDRVAAAAPRVTVVDLAAITFAGSVLLNFLAHVDQVLPAGSELVVCRPTPAVRRILTIGRWSGSAVVRDDPVPRRTG